MKIGKIYRVGIEDCCVRGSFKARLIMIDKDDEGYEEALHFDNGVVLYHWDGCAYEEVKE